jgi:hypothetical protein
MRLSLPCLFILCEVHLIVGPGCVLHHPLAQLIGPVRHLVPGLVAGKITIYIAEGWVLNGQTRFRHVVQAYRQSVVVHMTNLFVYCGRVGLM